MLIDTKKCNVSKYDYCYNIFRVYMAVASFTYNVLLVSIIIFLITLIYVGFYIYFNRNFTKKEPPTMNACPDYWKVDVSGNCIIPTNGTNMGSLNVRDPSNTKYMNSTLTYMNPNDPIWAKFGSPLCAQRTWARSNNITWEGVSNYNKC